MTPAFLRDMPSSGPGRAPVRSYASTARAAVVLLALAMPVVARAFQNDESRRQAQMESARASAAAIDRRNADQAFQAGLASAAAGRSGSGSSGSTGSSTSGSGGRYAPSTGGGGSSASTGPQSVVATRTYRIFVGETMEQAATRLAREAAGGNADSQYLLGRMQYAGYGVPQNAAEARRLFLAAASLQHVEAMAYAGDLLVNGVGGAVDLTRGMALLLAAADKGNPNAQALWGLKVMTAAFETRDNRLVPRALAMLEASANAGKALAQSTLGSLVYFSGIGGLAPDSVKSVRYLRMGAAQGDPISMYVLGNMLVNGDPWTGKNRAEGWPLIQRSSQAGDGRAMWRLALAKLQGSSGQAKDTEGGVRLMRQSAATGDRNGMFVLANMLLIGEEMPQNKPEGIRYARLAAEADHGAAQLMLAKMHYFGDDIPKNLAEAVRWARRSSESGTAGGEVLYGQLLWTGDGVPKDRVAAVRLFQRAAAQGDEEAIKNMADAEVQALVRTMTK